MCWVGLWGYHEVRGKKTKGLKCWLEGLYLVTKSSLSYKQVSRLRGRFRGVDGLLRVEGVSRGEGRRVSAVKSMS